MSSKMRRIERILDSQQNYLRNIRDDIVAGVREGLRQGGSEGAKKGAWHGLIKECLPQGLINIEGIPTEDIVGVISRLPISADIAQALGPEIKSGVGMYLDLVAARITRIPHSRKPSTEDIVQLVMRKYEAKDWIEERLPRNPIAKGIAGGIGSAFQKALTDSIETFSAKVEGMPDGDRKSTGEEFANLEGDEKLWQMRSTIRDSVRYTVARVAEELAYETTKLLTRRIIANLKKKLRQKSIHRLEEVLRRMTEQEFRKSLDKAADRFGEELVRDCADVRSLVNNIERGFEKGFEKYLSSLVKWLTPLKAIGITCVCLLVVVGTVFALRDHPSDGVVASPVLTCSTSSINFGEVPIGDTRSDTFEVWNSGGETLSYSLSEGATWLSLSSTSGTSTGEWDDITVYLDTSELDNVPYSASIDISSNGGTSSILVSVNVVVVGASPVLTCSTSSINFDWVGEGYKGSDTFEVWNSGGGTLSYSLSYSLSAGADWLSLSSTSGTSTGEHDSITVNLNTSGLSEGSTYLATIDISSNGEIHSISVWVGITIG